MDLVTYPTASAFRHDVEPFLLAHEAEHCVALGLIDTLVTSPTRYPKFHLLAAKEEGRVTGVAWMTPPWPFGLSRMGLGAFKTLFEAACRLSDRPQAVFGPAPLAEKFKDEWCRRHRVKASSAMAQRLYRATKIQAGVPIPGRMRAATPADLSLVIEWNEGFCDDCGIDSDPAQAKLDAEAVIGAGSRYLWELDGVPVSMAGHAGPTPSGVRVNWVYTPEEHRRKGYASALVAALSQKLLDSGKRFCFLYTDLANPTSNSIYQKIGYEPLSDFSLYAFSGRG
jgi:GNAT superfamily N-acetyltransferase